ncbi:hypothetical protein [Aegicerativicinus sediminis]|uniref:hypothetical protein n=1 Tax=Aegicerativicinus sediminis TaxID=2893202 RepID=UPI001E4F923A|nr:hypothetical protein [Aegicerativicinus sediminis]
MSKDIREMFKNSKLEDQQIKMPVGHEERFLQRLNDFQPKVKKLQSWMWLKIAASLIVFLGIGYFAINEFGNNSNVDASPANQVVDAKNTDDDNLKTLGDVSPDLKKVEDYYMAAINTELSGMKMNNENKDLIDGYLKRLEELNKEYTNLNKELTENGPNELTVNALIDNLKLRLNLLLRLREQLKSLGITDETESIS